MSKKLKENFVQITAARDDRNNNKAVKLRAFGFFDKV